MRAEAGSHDVLCNPTRPKPREQGRLRDCEAGPVPTTDRRSVADGSERGRGPRSGRRVAHRISQPHPFRSRDRVRAAGLLGRLRPSRRRARLRAVGPWLSGTLQPLPPRKLNLLPARAARPRHDLPARGRPARAAGRAVDLRFGERRRSMERNLAAGAWENSHRALIAHAPRIVYMRGASRSASRTGVQRLRRSFGRRRNGDGLWLPGAGRTRAGHAGGLGRQSLGRTKELGPRPARARWGRSRS